MSWWQVLWCALTGRSYVTRGALLSDIQADAAATRLAVNNLTIKVHNHHQKEAGIMATVAEVVARIDAATNNIAADVRGLHQRLQDALAGQDAAVQAALAGVVDQLLPLADKLDGIAAETPDAEPEQPEEPVEEPSEDEPADEEPVEEPSGDDAA